MADWNRLNRGLNTEKALSEQCCFDRAAELLEFLGTAVPNVFIPTKA